MRNREVNKVILGWCKEARSHFEKIKMDKNVSEKLSFKLDVKTLTGDQFEYVANKISRRCEARYLIEGFAADDVYLKYAVMEPIVRYRNGCLSVDVVFTTRYFRQYSDPEYYSCVEINKNQYESTEIIIE